MKKYQRIIVGIIIVILFLQLFLAGRPLYQATMLDKVVDDKAFQITFADVNLGWVVALLRAMSVVLVIFVLPYASKEESGNIFGLFLSTGIAVAELILIIYAKAKIQAALSDPTLKMEMLALSMLFATELKDMGTVTMLLGSTVLPIVGFGCLIWANKELCKGLIKELFSIDNIKNFFGSEKFLLTVELVALLAGIVMVGFPMLRVAGTELEGTLVLSDSESWNGVSIAVWTMNLVMVFCYGVYMHQMRSLPASLLGATAAVGALELLCAGAVYVGRSAAVNAVGMKLPFNETSAGYTMTWSYWGFTLMSAIVLGSSLAMMKKRK